MRVETLRSKRRWGHGRIPQLLVRVWCQVRGHDWREWNFDWPYDVPDLPESQRDPRPDEALLWYRGCHRDCGCIETAEATLLQRAGLPT